ncbi:ATP-binding protein [Kitasatospora sp. NPDC096128]|uniref:ATP-binding protein n=1 Tax=Kitasatospora sp. NPDC096128 TaxID=3155547 RepID=UPI003318A052
MVIRRWRDRDRRDHSVPAPASPPEQYRKYRMSLASSWSAAKVSRRITVTVLTGWGVHPKTTVHDAAVLAVTELVTNTVRHAQSRSPFFELLLVVTDTHLEVGVGDNHPGLQDLPEEGDTGGLAVVADLARHLSGGLTIRPGPNGGKTLLVRLPLTPSAATPE